MEKDRGIKTKTLSLRLDPKTKFSLEFVARIKGQTITTVVERAILESCNRVTIHGPAGFKVDDPCNWQLFWDAEEGIRTLLLLSSPEYPTNFDEDDLLEFISAHSIFFASDDEFIYLRRAFVHVLWPKIKSYRLIWKEQRDTDYWAAGRAMAVDLKAAKLTPPEWPPQTNATVKSDNRKTRRDAKR